jgi:hypothetical protein
MVDGCLVDGSCGEGNKEKGVGGKGPAGGGKGLILLEGGIGDPGMDSSFAECPWLEERR